MDPAHEHARGIPRLVTQDASAGPTLIQRQHIKAE